MDLTNESDLWEFSTGLYKLSNTDIDFFTFLFVDDDNEVIGALRFTNDYFE